MAISMKCISNTHICICILALIQVIAWHQKGNKPLPQPMLTKSSNTKVHHYCKTSNISRTLVGNKIVDNSDVVGASPVGAAPTTSSFST